MSVRFYTFQVDATPPMGHPLCNGSVPPAIKVIDPLSARGLVLEAKGQEPIVLCAVDWVTINNESHDLWRQTLADAAGTTIDRVSVHTTHPHDTPGVDRAAQRLLDAAGMKNAIFDPSFEADVLERLAAEVRREQATKREISHVSLGKAKVARFASSRRLIGPDGKVQHVRYSSCKDENVRAREEGLIDPFILVVGLWEGQRPVAVMSYYASHPQSFYYTGGISSDTTGLARAIRDAAVPTAMHLHFCGAGGNVAAGKYNDGAPTNRLRLAERLADGMERAWDNSVKLPLTAADVQWKVKEVAIPLAAAMRDTEAVRLSLNDQNTAFTERRMLARKLAFAERCCQGILYPLTCLRLGDARILQTPGELFVEYQIAAQAYRPGEFVALAAYGDCGPGYIGTKEAYAQGGYECDPRHARVAPEVEDVFLDAIRELLAD